MMIGERSYQNPTVLIPPWPMLDDPTLTNAEDYYAVSSGIFPYDESDVADADELGHDPELYGSDHFRMFEFKVRKCTRGRSHDWTECPFVHTGEKARRRDPRKFHYSGTACPEFRKGNCKKGDACEYGHGVFECWLHPSRYRTQPCKDGLACPRPVCFFAHSPLQLRQSFSSPPVSPPSTLATMTRSLQQLQLSKTKSMPSHHHHHHPGPTLFEFEFPGRSGFLSLPTTPTGIRRSDIFEEEEAVMERVESGRGLRAIMFEKLSRENFVNGVDPGPDIGWVSDLLE